MEQKWERLVGTWPEHLRSDLSSDILGNCLRYAANARNPVLSIKEKMAKLIVRGDCSYDDLVRQAEDFIEKDYALLYRFDEGIDDVFTRNPYRYGLHGLGTIEAHKEYVGAINEIMAKHSGIDAAVALFELFVLENDNPLFGLTTENYLSALENARNDVRMFLSSWQRDDDDDEDDAPDLEEIKNRVMALWKRNPVASGGLEANISLLADYENMIANGRHTAASYSRDEELEKIFSDKRPQAIYEALRYRASRDGMANNELATLKELCDIEKKGNPEKSEIEHILRNYEEKLLRWAIDMESETDDGLKNKTISRERANLRMDISRIYREQIQKKMTMLKSTVKDYGRLDEAVHRLQMALAKDEFSAQSCLMIPARDLVEFYKKAITDYPEALKGFSPNSGKSIEKVKEEIRTFWRNNPVASTYLGDIGL